MAVESRTLFCDARFYSSWSIWRSRILSSAQFDSRSLITDSKFHPKCRLAVTRGSFRQTRRSASGTTPFSFLKRLPGLADR